VRLVEYQVDPTIVIQIEAIHNLHAASRADIKILSCGIKGSLNKICECVIHPRFDYLRRSSRPGA